MAANLSVLVFSMAVICSEYRLVEALGRPGFFEVPYSRSSLRNPTRYQPALRAPPRQDPWRMNLPRPFEDDPATINESLDLFNQGLRRDPCTDYCAPDVIPSEITKDCGDIVKAIILLAENDHSRVKSECATAREHGCQYAVFQGYSCKFKVTVLREGCSDCIGRKLKEEQYKLSDCLNEIGQNEIEMV